jgi:hypothetical protein
MQGIRGQPYLSLDSFIDMDHFTSLEFDIMKGIALSKRYLATYGPSVDDPDVNLELTQVETLFNQSQLSPEIQFKAQEINDINSRRFFLKLATGCFAPASTVHLRRHVGPHSERGLRRASEEDENTRHFPSLMNFINTLPFEEFGRILFFVHEHRCPIPIHRDGTCYKPHNHEFIYLRTNFNSKFFIFDKENKKRHYVDKKAIFFNERDFHGGDPSPRMTFSLRIDGRFNLALRKQLEIDHLDYY